MFTQNLRFPGQYADIETGLYQNGFRDYNPAWGRYLESDPVGPTGGINTFGYVGGNPISGKDRRGLDSDSDYFDTPFINPECNLAGAGCVDINSPQPSATITVSIGAGGVGTISTGGAGSDSGVAFDNTGNICLYGNSCFYVGENTIVSGSIGIVGQISAGALCTGEVISRGAYFPGGQITFGDDSSVAYGRAIYGPTAGTGGGSVICRTEYQCLRN